MFRLVRPSRFAATRLQQFIAAELCALVAGIAFGVTLYIEVLPSPWMLSLVVICAAKCVLLALALRLAHRRLQQSVVLVCIGNWVSALLVTFVAPVMLPVMVLAALLPPIFAEPYVRGQRLRTFALITAACALALALLAGLQDASRIAKDAPAAAVNIVIIATLPIMAVLMLLIVWHNAAGLRRTARAARRNEAALRVSEQLLAQHVAELAGSRARLNTAADAERRRLERDLHDGAQQHLVALAVLIQLARTSQGNRTDSLLAEASALLKTAIDEIRRIAHGIYPQLLVAGGLAQALPAAAKHAAVPVRVSLQDLGRYPASIEAALYYCCTEALQNAAKHGGPDTTATITACGDDKMITLTVSDTGRGFDRPTIGTGLTNMRDRLAAIGGTLVIDAAPGRGTRVIASVAAPAPPATPELQSDQAFQLVGSSHVCG